MSRKTFFSETAGVVAVLLILAGVPLLLWYWKAFAVPKRYPPGTKIVHLTAISDSGIWTDEHVAGYNYWWKNPARIDSIRLARRERVALLLHSPDVQHSFAMRDLRIGPLQIPAGHTVEVKFETDSDRVLDFLCVQVCGRDHSQMKGSFLVGERTQKPKEPTDAGAAVTPTGHHH